LPSCTRRRRDRRRLRAEHGRLGASERTRRRRRDRDAAPRRGARQGRQFLHRQSPWRVTKDWSTRSRANAEETYEPHFTFQGSVTSPCRAILAGLTLDRLTGVVIHSDLARTGHWECSNPLLNQLQHNIVWGQKGTSSTCRPTARNATSAWAGRATRRRLCERRPSTRRSRGFSRSGLRDLAADQKDNGAVPVVIPDVIVRGEPTDSSSGWGDVATIAPWTIHLVYGDTRILEIQYPSMKAWVEFIRSRAQNDLWNTGFHFGDWLSYATTDPGYPGATTGKDLIARHSMRTRPTSSPGRGGARPGARRPSLCGAI